MGEDGLFDCDPNIPFMDMAETIVPLVQETD